MSKKLVEKPIFINTIEEVKELSKTHNRNQKIIFDCCQCGKPYTTSMYNRGGGLRTTLICYKCKRSNTMLERFGSTSITETEYFKEKSLKTKLERYGNPFYNNPEKQKETMNALYGGQGFASTELLSKQKETMVKKYGVENPMESRSFINIMKKRYKYNDINFDSSWELCLYIYLVDNNIDFIYQPDKSLKYEYNGKYFMYIPDFEINGKLYEIKGDQFFNDDGTMKCPFHPEESDKLNAKCNFAKSIGVTFLRYEQIKKYIDYVTQTYGKKYIKQFKNY